MLILHISSSKRCLQENSVNKIYSLLFYNIGILTLCIAEIITLWNYVIELISFVMFLYVIFPELLNILWYIDILIYMVIDIHHSTMCIILVLVFIQDFLHYKWYRTFFVFFIFLSVFVTHFDFLFYKVLTQLFCIFFSIGFTVFI